MAGQMIPYLVPPLCAPCNYHFSIFEIQTFEVVYEGVCQYSCAQGGGRRTEMANRMGDVAVTGAE